MENELNSTNLVSVIKDSNGCIISKNLYQSFITSFAKYNYSINEERILISVINSLQEIIKDSVDNINNDIVIKMLGSFDYIEVDVCISDLCEHSRTIRSTELVDVCKSLSNKNIIIEYRDKKTNETIYKNVNLLNGYMEFTNQYNVRLGINKDIALCLVDMAMGYSSYNMKYILRLKSSYSMRIFRFICNKTGSSVFYISINSFIDKMCLSDSYIKYKNNLYSLLKRIVDDINSEHVGWDKKTRFHIENDVIHFDVASKNDDFDDAPVLKSKTNGDNVKKVISMMELTHGKDVINIFRKRLYMNDKIIAINRKSISQFIAIYINGTSEKDKVVNNIRFSIDSLNISSIQTKRKYIISMINAYISSYNKSNN